MHEISIYVHWPFCLKKCPYCDFNSHVAKNKVEYEQWRHCFAIEIASFSKYFIGKKIISVFFGGGTPSLMEPKTIQFILKELQKYADFASNIEITMEANPTSIEMQKFQDFRVAGINRVSVGVQSFNQDNLKFLGREHSANEAIEALQIANQVFDNFSFDLIYCLPGQKLEDWLKELDFALSLVKNHLSLYQLTIEKGTEFFRRHKNGEFAMPNVEIAADFFEKTTEILEKNGLIQYEVSNYAKPGFECRHNLNYWNYGEFLGIGPGAHSRVQDDNNQWCSINTFYQPEIWLKNLQAQGNAVQKQKILSDLEVLEEFIMMSLRTKSGIDLQKLTKLIGFERIIKKISVLQENSLLLEENNHLQAANFLNLNRLTEFLLT